MSIKDLDRETTGYSNDNHNVYERIRQTICLPNEYCCDIFDFYAF